MAKETVFPLTLPRRQLPPAVVAPAPRLMDVTSTEGPGRRR
ncbi:hypothetical protein [Streptomyces erythrochromogenes]|nr:hypothetical protein OG364_06075 [Streptomyces erythrochromogenes]